MNAADSREGAIERAVLNLAEAALLRGREGEVFRALVIERDEKGRAVATARPAGGGAGGHPQRRER